MVESLDRSHTGLIRHARFLSQSPTGAVLELTAVGDCQLELSGIENEADNFKRIFGKPLITQVVTAELEELHERNENFPALFTTAGDRQ